jgi:uncharacterized protein YecT (DUF1311 family)
MTAVANAIHDLAGATARRAAGWQAAANRLSCAPSREATHVILLLLLAAAVDPCAAAERRSGVAERSCFARLAEETDREMAAQWRATLRALRRDDDRTRRDKLNLPIMTTNLLASQRAWLRYRDAQCGTIGDQAAGGTGYGELDSRCRIELNRRRTSELKRRAAGMLMPPFP